ncbi:MAG: RtcB family protein, partial [Rhodospirillaceae bacterium]|nr:RtcB family protein [Rhodospirillaceae bacterium]
YGFPIGGVAAFDADAGGVISGGGVGFDIACGVRTLTLGVSADDIKAVRERLIDALFKAVPTGLGSTGDITLSLAEMNAMLDGGAKWAIEQGWGEARDLDFIEERGCMDGARPEQVSAKAKTRQQKEMGTLGSGNHYLEVQEVQTVYDADAAAAFGLEQGQALVSIHCGSRALGHQIGTEYLSEMASTAKAHGIDLPERELACAPIKSDLGQSYLGAMRAGINCALANRQIITHLMRRVFEEVMPQAEPKLIYDISHNTCKEETHEVDGAAKRLFVHRKGATRAFGPGHTDIPQAYRGVGQPVLIGGSMGTASYILAGVGESEAHGFGSACHGAGRCMSRHAALRKWRGRQVVDELAAKGILVRGASQRGIAEEAPSAYKDVDRVIEVTHNIGLAKKVARLKPLLCIKG